MSKKLHANVKKHIVKVEKCKCEACSDGKKLQEDASECQKKGEIIK